MHTHPPRLETKAHAMLLVLTQAMRLSIFYPILFLKKKFF